MPLVGEHPSGTLSFPRLKTLTVRLQPASHSSGTTNEKTKESDLSPAHSCANLSLSPPHFPPLTWVILSTETGIPSMVRGGSSELTSCGAGACSARADSRSSRIMLLYLRTCRELRAEVNKMPNNQGGLVPDNKRVGGAGLPQPLQCPKNKHFYN